LASPTASQAAHPGSHPTGAAPPLGSKPRPTASPAPKIICMADVPLPKTPGNTAPNTDSPPRGPGNFGIMEQQLHETI
jgi:hypothetical protein